jgi:hypothetical protein
MVACSKNTTDGNLLELLADGGYAPKEAVTHATSSVLTNIDLPSPLTECSPKALVVQRQKFQISLGLLEGEREAGAVAKTDTFTRF